jgi:hypothetical protein
MPSFFRAIGDELKTRLNQKDTAPVNTQSHRDCRRA